MEITYTTSTIKSKTKEELKQWVEYKKEKALAFVNEGYSVEWSPNGNHVMEVYMPEINAETHPKIRASIRFFQEPFPEGLEGGRISKLSILEQKGDLFNPAYGKMKRFDEIYSFSREETKDNLKANSPTKKLFDTVVRELN